MYFAIKYINNYYCEMPTFNHYQWYIKKFCKRFTTKNEAKLVLKEIRKEFKEAKIIKIWQKGELFKRISHLEEKVKKLSDKIDFLEDELSEIRNNVAYLEAWNTPF